MSHKPSLSLLLTGLYSPVVSRILCCGCSFPLARVNKIVMRLGLNLQHAKELHQTASCVTFSFRIYRDSITEQYMKINIISQNLIGTYIRPVTRGGARGAFAPSPQAPKVRILILNIQVKESSRLN